MKTEERQRFLKAIEMDAVRFECDEPAVSVAMLQNVKRMVHRGRVDRQIAYLRIGKHLQRTRPLPSALLVPPFGPMCSDVILRP